MSGDTEIAREQVLDILRREDRFLVASHVNPDGDALGSVAAMGHVLAALGKEFRLYSQGGVPEAFRWLEMPGPVAGSLEELGGYRPDRILALDASTAARLGGELEQRLDMAPVANIDHHPDNSRFGAVNWVDPGRSAVGEMVADLARALGVPLSGPLGRAVYLAVVTDTGYFAYDNTKAETHELAAEIIRLGLEPGGFASVHLSQWSVGRLKLFSRVLADAAFHCDGRIGVARVPASILEETGTTVQDTDGLVDQVRKVRTVLVAMALRDADPGWTKFSLRSEGDTNVQKIAALFGGGGHRNASGGRIQASMQEAEQRLVAAARESLELDC